MIKGLVDKTHGLIRQGIRQYITEVGHVPGTDGLIKQGIRQYITEVGHVPGTDDQGTGRLDSWLD